MLPQARRRAARRSGREVNAGRRRDRARRCADLHAPHLKRRRRRASASTRARFRRAWRARSSYFPGVEAWFERMNAYVGKRSGGRVKVQPLPHLGGAEGDPRGRVDPRHFRRIYASEYHFNRHGVADLPQAPRHRHREDAVPVPHQQGARGRSRSRSTSTCPRPSGRSRFRT